MGGADKDQKLRMRKAVYQGAIAFIIAICAAFDLTVAPFWMVFLSSFFFTIDLARFFDVFLKTREIETSYR